MMNESPEECIAKVMSSLGPQQSCSLASVSRTFNSASESDLLWESFLPADYRSIISQSSDPALLSDSVSKKHLFRRLCQQPILLDQGKKSWTLEARRGNISMMVGARDLEIAWGDTPEYWRWKKDKNSRFAGKEVAALQLVWWLETRAKIRTRRLSPRTTYGAYLVFKLADSNFGFTEQPVKVGVGFVGDETARKEGVVNLLPAAGAERSRIKPSDLRVEQPEKRGDRWWELKLGEFKNGEEDEEVEISFMEVKSGHPKYGLIVHGVEIRPAYRMTIWIQSRLVLPDLIRSDPL